MAAACRRRHRRPGAAAAHFGADGTNPLDIINSSAPPSDRRAPPARRPENDPQAQFVSVVLKDTEDDWGEVFQRAATRTSRRCSCCSPTRPSRRAASASPPWGRSTARPIGRSTSTCRSSASSTSDSARPATSRRPTSSPHEVGHHVQTLTGTSSACRRARQRGGEREANELSVRQELQADCYAGVWGHYAAQHGLLEPGDAEEGLRAAAAIGDDRLQRQSQGRVVPESFTHGSSEQRVEWLRRGLDSGQLSKRATPS